MNIKETLAVIGGDLRQIKMAEGLSDCGYNIFIYGFGDSLDFSKSINIANSLEHAVASAKAVVLPLPCTTDDITLNTRLHNGKIYLDDLVSKLSPEHLVLGGKITKGFKSKLENEGIKHIDYYDREELIILNAIPTAEGAIQIAMEEMDITLHGSRCLVLGFGRIGKILAKMLYGIGANVTVEARSHGDLAYIQSYGYNGINLNNLSESIGEYDCIFNTIPSIILDANLLNKINKRCLVIDLASKPGGVDICLAGRIGVKVIWAQSLPGKVAPNTAGAIIKETIKNILTELG